MSQPCLQCSVLGSTLLKKSRSFAKKFVRLKFWLLALCVKYHVYIWWTAAQLHCYATYQIYKYDSKTYLWFGAHLNFHFRSNVWLTDLFDVSNLYKPWWHESFTHGDCIGQIIETLLLIRYNQESVSCFIMTKWWYRKYRTYPNTKNKITASFWEYDIDRIDYLIFPIFGIAIYTIMQFL